MIPGSYPLTLYRGDSGRWRFVLWNDPLKRVPADLTDVVAKAEIREQAGGLTITPLQCTVELPNAVSMVLAASASAQLPAMGAWDLQLTYPDGTVATILAGSVSVIADVTDSTPAVAPGAFTGFRGASASPRNPPFLVRLRDRA
jgi:hypothetical protein